MKIKFPVIESVLELIMKLIISTITLLWDHQNVQIHFLHPELDEVLAEMFNFNYPEISWVWDLHMYPKNVFCLTVVLAPDIMKNVPNLCPEYL